MNNVELESILNKIGIFKKIKDENGVLLGKYKSFIEKYKANFSVVFSSFILNFENESCFFEEYGFKPLESNPWMDGNLDTINIFFDLERMIEETESYADTLPSSLIPIGSDIWDNLYCLGINEPYIDHVYFMDHELESFEEGNKLYLVSDSFQNFLCSFQKINNENI